MDIMCFLFIFPGANVRKVLKILDVLDSHTFFSCRAHNPLTTLYCSLSTTQCSFEVPLTDEMLTMLLCQWAVTPYRSGEHRPLVVAMLLRQRQDDIMKVRMCCHRLKFYEFSIKIINSKKEAVLHVYPLYCLQGDDWRKDIDKNALDDSWEEEELQVTSPILDFPFPFQTTLIKFLDKRAPLPGTNYE